MNVDMNKLCNKFLSNEIVLKDTTILDELGINMNELAKSCKYDPVIGRDNQINRIIQVLLRKNKNNPLLIGDAGVGKTAIVEEIARRISLGNVPLKLKDKIIYSISMSVLVAGTKYRGEFEEKIHKLLKEVISNENIILFIDEVHTLMGAGGAEGAIDASNIIKPYLARGDIKVIGATTVEEYSKFIEKDRALDRRFQKIYVEEPSKDEVKSILMELRSVYEKYHNVILRKNIIDLILKYSYTCLFNGRQPDRAIDLLDEVCSYAVTSNNNLELVNLEIDINNTERLKNEEIIKHNFKKALILKNKEIKLRNSYNNLLINNSSNNKIIISKKMVDEVIYNKNRINKNIDYSLFRKSVSKYDNSSRDELINCIRNYNYINNTKSLIVSLVNKNVLENTFLIDKLVEFTGYNYISININDYKDHSSINKLIGTTSGYVGYNDSYLLQSIKENPLSIIYIYNVESNNRVIKIFSDGVDKGYIVSNRNEKINISKCIIILGITNISNNIGFNNKLNTDNDLINKSNKIIYFNSKSVLI